MTWILSNIEWIFSGVGISTILFFATIWLQRKRARPTPKAGNVVLHADVFAGNGSEGDGGNVYIEAGRGSGGASGGNIDLGPGTYRAGNGGQTGKGGDLVVKAGDAMK
jgi:hypothetical protein